MSWSTSRKTDRLWRELFRVLKPDGWALISVPIRLDQKTFEDPTIVTPEERTLAFGEDQHVRFYGYDLTERLEACGFRVRLDLGEDVDQQTAEKYGLLDNENIFHCSKPVPCHSAAKPPQQSAIRC